MKTRLAAVLGAAQAGRLYAAMLLDTLATLRRTAARRESAAAIAFRGAGRLPARFDAACRGLLRTRQGGGDLGARQADLQERLFRAGARAVALIGSDSPTLGASRIERAFAALTRHDAAVIPARDGGYVLLALARPQRGLFDGLPWGTSGVMGAAQRRARQLGLSLRVLPAWYDVDDASGLARLRGELANTGATVAPATRRALQSLALPDANLRPWNGD